MGKDPENELLTKISFESSDSFLKSKNEKTEDFDQVPIIFFVMLKGVGTEKSPEFGSYQVYDDLNDEVILCTCPTSNDTKRDEIFEEIIKNYLNSNEHKTAFSIMNWIRNKFEYKYISSLKIGIDPIDNVKDLSLTLMATGLKLKKTKSAPPPILRLPSA